MFSFSFNFKVLISFLISALTHFSFNSELFSCREFVNFMLFYCWWYPALIHGGLNLYLLRLALCPSVWSILEKVPWGAEKKVYSFVFWQNKYVNMLGLFSFWHQLTPAFLCLVFVWMLPFCWWEWGIEVSHYLYMRVSMWF